MGTNGYFAGHDRRKLLNQNRDYATDFEFLQIKEGKRLGDNLHPEEQKSGISESIPRVKTLIRQYCQPECTMHKHLKPISVQRIQRTLQRFACPNQGYADLIAYHGYGRYVAIVDMKVQKRRPMVGHWIKGIRSVFYAFAEMMKRDLDYLPAGEIHCFVRKKKTPELEHNVPEADRR